MTRLVDLQLHRAPGIQRSFALAALDGGLVLLVGPNASGKSTVGRTIGHALWPAGVPRELLATLRFANDDGAQAVAEIAAGQVTWSPSSPDVAGAAASAWRLTVAELLGPHGKSDAAIAERIERELNGGFDLRRARNAFRAASPNPRPPSGVSRALNTANEEVRRALDGADALARKESDLKRLIERQQEAATAADRRALANDALTRAQRLAEAEVFGRQLADFPAGLDALPEDALQLVAAGRERLDEEQSAHADAVAALDELNAEIAAQRFSGPPPFATDIDTWRRRVTELAELSRQQTAIERRIAGAEAAVRQGADALFAPSASGAQPTAAQLGDLAAHLDDARVAQARHEAAAAALTNLGEPDAALSGVELADVDEAIGVLRRWLVVPESAQDTLPKHERVLAALIGVALFCALVGGVMGSTLAFVSAAFAAAALVVLWTRKVERDAATSQDAATQRRRAIVAGWPASIEAPQWSFEPAQSALSRLEKLATALRREHHLVDERRRSRTALAHTEQQLGQADDAVAGWVATLGLAPHFADLPLHRQAHQLAALAEAELTCTQAQAELAELNKQVERGTVELRAAVTVWAGDALGGRADRVDVHDLGSAIESIATRTQKLTDLEPAARRAAAAVKACHTRALTASSELAGLWQRFGVPAGDEAELHRRVGMLAQFRTIVRDRDGAVRDVELLDAKLGDDALVGQSEAALRDEIARLQALSDELKDRSDAVAEVQYALKEARESTSVADLGAAAAAAAEAFADTRAKVAEDCVGAALVDWIAGEVAREQAPAVLQRARRLLLSFTHGRYRLDVDADRGFVARDTTVGTLRGLAELSDGTRMQALLAARLAYIELAEDGGERLPLFLDEALSTTDPARFAEVAACLLSLVADGRQIIYATADPSEAQQFQEAWAAAGQPPPALIAMPTDGADENARWTPDIPATPPSTQPVPAPDGMNVEQYVQALGISRPDVWSPAQAWSIVHALHDDLPAAYACLSSGVRTVGPFIALADNPDVLPVPAETIEQVRRWYASVTASLEVLRIGRNQRVPWDEVERSGAISASFVDRVREVWRDGANDAVAFVDAVAALPRMRGTSVAQLREHLESTGLIDERAVLTAAEAVVLVCGGAANAGLAAPPNVGEVRQVVLWVARACGLELTAVGAPRPMDAAGEESIAADS